MYLRQRDFDRVIKSDELAQYIDTDTGIQNLAYLTVLATVRAHLKQKYYVNNNTELHQFPYDYEFSDTNVYAATVTYVARNRVELNFAAYVPANTYNPGDQASVGTSQYICKNTTTGTFNAGNWYSVGTQYDIWNLALPFPLFDMRKQYKIGDTIYYKGSIYTALQPSTFFLNVPQADGDGGLAPNIGSIQALYTDQIPYPNVFPDDPLYGTTFWGTGVPYSVSGIAPNIPLSNWTAYNPSTNYVQGNLATYNGVLYMALKTIPNTAPITPGTDITAWQSIVWQLGDNRDQIVLDCFLHILVYDLTPRIMIDQTPDLRSQNKKRAIDTLEDIEHGVITPDMLIPFQTTKGMTVSWGGASKRENQF